MTAYSGPTLTGFTHPQMIPSQPQSTAKRKVVDDSNPLLNAAKRAKKEVRSMQPRQPNQKLTLTVQGKPGASNKRKRGFHEWGDTRLEVNLVFI